MFLNVLKSIRPHEWTKNLFLFAGILFSQHLFDPVYLGTVLLAFFTFCLLSGSAYIMNDLVDSEKDRCHPLKSERPIACGDLKTATAIVWLFILVPVSLGLALILNKYFFLVALCYFLLQILYSFVLKGIVIIDVFCISSNFLLRMVGGAVVINVEISAWFVLCAMLLSLYLSLGKRRHELIFLDDDAQNHRKVLEHYSPQLLDQMIAVVAAATVISYALYTMSEETIAKFDTRNLFVTIPFVLYGIFRYLYLIHQKGSGGNPGKLLFSDKPLLVNVILWISAIIVILYG
jgi:4-hydroxybenzoate polyprenyltransferase